MFISTYVADTGQSSFHRKMRGIKGCLSLLCTLRGELNFVFKEKKFRNSFFFNNKRIYSWNTDLITGLTSENDQEHNPQVRQFPLNMVAKLHFSIGNSAKVSTLE